MMSKQNVPELRFPEFSGEWEEKKLKDTVEPIKGNDGNLGETPIMTISAKRGWLNQEERFSQVIAGNSLKKYTLLKKNDLSYNKGNSKAAKYGIVYRSNYERALVPNVYKSFRTLPEIDSRFIELYFHTLKLDRQLRKLITSTARMDGLLNISDQDFYNITLYMPSESEQKKIGEFFSKLDRLIELEEKKLELLEEQKKGYMQKIFSQELRFKDENGNDYLEWENKKVGDLGTIVTGNTPSKKVKKYWDSNDFAWVTPSDISNKKSISISESYLSTEGYKKARRLPKGSLLITCIASIGKNAILNIEGSCNQQINAIIPKKEYDVNYLYYRFEEISNHMKLIAGKTATQILNKSAFEKLSIEIPVFEEQFKIGGFLSKLDKKIESQQKKISYIATQKQGLLQKIFI